MDETWRHGYPTCMDESIAEHIKRSRREESGFRKPTGDNVRWESRHWRTKSSSTRSERFSTRCFEHREEAEQFLEQLRERLAKFGLELHPRTFRNAIGFDKCKTSVCAFDFSCRFPHALVKSGRA